MSLVSDVTVAVTGDGPGPRSDADPCNPLLILDTGSILTANTEFYILHNFMVISIKSTELREDIFAFLGPFR